MACCWDCFFAGESHWVEAAIASPSHILLQEKHTESLPYLGNPKFNFINIQDIVWPNHHLILEGSSKDSEQSSLSKDVVLPKEVPLHNFFKCGRRFFIF